jgi:adenylosuccinate synthase
VPITIVAGGQFGSEGKGKIAHFMARERRATAAVRVGGPNSGHTVYDDAGAKFIFQHLPTAAVLPDVMCVLAAGSYIDVSRLRDEIQWSGLDPSRLKVDPHAVIVTERDCLAEQRVGLREGVGSTLTGTGAAVLNRISRTLPITFASQVPELRPFLSDTKELLSRMLDEGQRVVIEGTQGYGLSVLHTPYYPFATSRDTTAAGFLSETGLSPLDVDDIVLVIRAFPIRVPGNSGPLPNECTWEEISKASASFEALSELTSVTKAVRRVAHFDAAIVNSAIRSNRPTTLVLNHVDYFDKRQTSRTGSLSPKTIAAVSEIEKTLLKRIDLIGTSGTALSKWATVHALRA